MPPRDFLRRNRDQRLLSSVFHPQRTVAVIELMDDSINPQPEARITSRLIDALYTEAMLLADEARAYFDDAGRDDRSTLEPFVRVGFACESLKVTTRIMHIVAWLLTQRAIESGRVARPRGSAARAAAGPCRRTAIPTGRQQLPPAAQRLIDASGELYARIKRIDEGRRRRRTGAKPCPRADGPARTRARWGISAKQR